MNINVENKKQIATILLAIGLGFVAVFLTTQYVEKENQKRAMEFKKQLDSQKAAIVKEVDARLVEMNNRMAAQQQELARQMQNQQRAPIGGKPGSEIVDNTVFSVVTPPGKRALTILIDSLSAVGGLVNPGDYVDVIANLEVPRVEDSDKEVQKVTTVLFQNVQVLAVGANFKPVGNSLIYQSQQKARSLNVTLAVDPSEATLLTFAQEHGKLQLALRAPTEKETKSLEVASWNALSDYILNRQGTEMSIPKKKGAQKVEETPSETSDTEVEPFIQIFRGGKEL